ncbi:MAG: type I-C CRISPR-associated protein Cas8c/Csd1 [Dehalococcoidia bacterium]|nr:type I-C CRISPR-associated protein Cas8c/Csd1 [Dehalococcoidia bacterium]
MLLRRLVEYADRLDLPPPLYAESVIRYRIRLDSNGNLLVRQPDDTADPTSPTAKNGMRRRAPEVKRTSAIRAFLLCDRVDYALGIPPPDASPEEQQAVQRRHAEFVALAERCAHATQEPAVWAVVRFLKRGGRDEIELPPNFDYRAKVVFQVDGRDVIDLPSVQRFWEDEHTQNGPEATRMQCVVCGEDRPVLKRLQSSIKGIPGGQTSGVSMISANVDAFESYGLEASLIAPTCEQCGERFTKALNALLAGDYTKMAISNLVYVFWTRDDTDTRFVRLMIEPEPSQVRELLRGIWSGNDLSEDIASSAFYCVCLSANGARAVVRDWIDTTVGNAAQMIGRWFRMQDVVDQNGRYPTPMILGLLSLIRATAREINDTPKRLISDLVRAALTGAPLPRQVLDRAVQRARVDRDVTMARAALLLLYFRSNQLIDEGRLSMLDPAEQSPAYRCGRLLSLLGEAQRQAIGDINATVIERFYGAASSTPAIVFPRLLRLTQTAHLPKLERDRRGAYIALDREITEVCDGLDRFPATLSTVEQGMFALGFYHQRAESRRRQNEAIMRRRAPTASEDESSTDDNG